MCIRGCGRVPEQVIRARAPGGSPKQAQAWGCCPGQAWCSFQEAALRADTPCGVQYGGGALSFSTIQGLWYLLLLFAGGARVRLAVVAELRAASTQLLAVS